MGKDIKRTLGIIPVKEHSNRFPGKNFHEYMGKPLWRHAYDNLKPICTKTRVFSDTVIEGLDYHVRPKNAADSEASILDVLRYAYMILNEPYDIIVCLFANTIDFTPGDINEAIVLLKMYKLQEVRGFNQDTGVENGLMVMTKERLFNPPGISSYMGCVSCEGKEIHYKEELSE